MKSQNGNKGEIIIYRTEDGKTSLEVKLQEQTVWLTQDQMGRLFKTTKQNVSLHIQNLFDENELEQKSTVKESLTVRREGGRDVARRIAHYNLDVIISVGYRVKSKRGTQFRTWATKVLREHLVKGYTLNRKSLLLTNAKVAELQRTIDFITSVRDRKLSSDEAQGLLTIIKQYADTWTTLEAYDSGKLKKRTSSKKSLHVSYEEVRSELEQLKRELVRKEEASDLFAVEHGHALERIMGAVFQTFGGKELYPSIEEKAAHLLYFIIKDHPFSDGNKRSGSFVFLMFLRKNKSLVRKNGEAKISDMTLTALALLIAESKPSEKDRMIALITNLLKD